MFGLLLDVTKNLAFRYLNLEVCLDPTGQHRFLVFQTLVLHLLRIGKPYAKCCYYVDFDGFTGLMRDGAYGAGSPFVDDGGRGDGRRRARVDFLTDCGEHVKGVSWVVMPCSIDFVLCLV